MHGVFIVNDRHSAPIDLNITIFVDNRAFLAEGYRLNARGWNATAHKE